MINHLQDSVVTQLCLDYGMIDGAIYFTNEEVLGGVQLKEGDLVNCTAVRYGEQGGWKALRVRNNDLYSPTNFITPCNFYMPLVSYVVFWCYKVQMVITVCSPSLSNIRI